MTQANATTTTTGSQPAIVVPVLPAAVPAKTPSNGLPFWAWFTILLIATYAIKLFIK